MAPTPPDLTIPCDGFACTGGCDSDGDCKGGKRCDPKDHVCRVCVVDKDCAAGQLCSAATHTCLEGCSSMHSCASDGGVCETDAGQCVQCLGDTDCKDPSRPRCDPASNQCFPCYTANDNCGLATYCASSMSAYSCAPGCKNDTDCAPVGVDGGGPGDGGDLGDGGASPPDGGGGGGGPDGKALLHCESGMHQCVACLVDNDCPLGKTCQGHACLDGCTMAHACPLPKACCSGACVDQSNDFSNCGACGQACQGGFNCCNAACSNPVGDVVNCGGCGLSCAVMNGTPACVNRGCTIGTCNAGWGDCNGKYMDGCEINTQTSLSNCGACGNVCMVPHSVAKCTGGACLIDTCLPSFADCNKVVGDGCEVNINGSDVNNCGSCRHSCNGTNGTPSCNNGACAITCNQGWGDCDMIPFTGCEVDLTTTVTSCGACNKVCSSVNGTASCVASVCKIACAPNWGDCDGNVDNGCETNLLITASACSMCGAVCSSVNGTPSCVAGGCKISCNPNWGDCDGNVVTGCETNLLTTTSACGACGAACSGAHVQVNTCTGGSCTGLCVAGYGDCDANLRVNGCETNLLTTPSACGACGTACPGTNMASNTCTAGACTGTCAAGFGDCDANLRTNGCEINLNTSAPNCGACNAACPGVNMASNTCTAGACTGICSAGFADCDANLRTNGCETSIFTSVSSCGGCNTACSGANMSVVTCTQGSCTGTCAPNFADCDANLRTNGCEINTSTSVTACGGCGQACSTTGITRACAGGSCEGGVCTAGNFDVNANKRADGCECAAPGTNTCGSREIVGVLAWNTSVPLTTAIPGTQAEHFYDVAWNTDGSANPPNYHPHVTIVTNSGSAVLFDVYTYDCALSGNFACGAEGGLSLGRTVWESNQTAGDVNTGATQGPFTWTSPAPGTHVLVRVRGTNAASCSNYTITFSNK